MELLEEYFDTAFDAPDGIKKLRELILTLAMQGKLVPQDPADQPASELLKEIEAEKQRLIEEKKIKKQKALPAIKDEEVPFDIPARWEWVRLGSIGIINPRNAANDEQTAGFVPMPQIFSEWGKPHTSEERQWKIIKKGYTHFAKGDIGIAKITPCFENAKSCVFENLPGDVGAGTTELHVFRNTFNAVSPQFLLAFFKNPRFIRAAIPHMTGSAGQKRVPKNYISDSPLPLPPLEEQRRIVAKIDQLMARCDELEKLRAAKEEKRISVHTSAVRQLLDAKEESSFSEAWQFLTDNFGDLYSAKENVAELRKAILQLAVMGKLVPQDAGDQPAQTIIEKLPNETARLREQKGIKKQKKGIRNNNDETHHVLPVSWASVYFEDLAYLITDGTHQTPKYVSAGRPFLSAKNVKPFRFMPENHKFVSEQHFEKYRVSRTPEKGDVLLTRVGAGIGEAAMIDTDIEFALYVSLCLIKIPTSCIIPEYLVIWLNSPEGRAYSSRRTYGKGASQGNLNLSLIRTFRIPLPPLPEQKRIVAKVDQLMDLCDNLKQQIDHSTAKQSDLLNAVMARV